ncbi:MAG: hypothetical protein H7A26_02060 [Spirochaetales bacterium]|nr:hypothetical protein [Spirochaetales bacterium]
MTNIKITEDSIIIRITGWDRVFALKSSVTIPRKCITRAYALDDSLKPPFFRCPGTGIPKILIAGTFYDFKRKEFWLVHFSNKALVLDLKGFRYTRVVVDTSELESILEMLF